MSPETNAWGAVQPVVARALGVWGAAAKCVYCGRRCKSCHLACYRHADLPALDTRYALAAREGTGLR